MTLAEAMLAGDETKISLEEEKVDLEEKKIDLSEEEKFPTLSDEFMHKPQAS